MKLELTRHFSSEQYNLYCFFQPPQEFIGNEQELVNELVSAPNPLDRFRVPTPRLLPPGYY